MNKNIVALLAAIVLAILIFIIVIGGAYYFAHHPDVTMYFIYAVFGMAFIFVVWVLYTIVKEIVYSD